MGLILDPQLIRDLSVLITSSTIGGLAMEFFKQPTINGFFIAGSVVGPGGLKLVKVPLQQPHGYAAHAVQHADQQQPGSTAQPSYLCIMGGWAGLGCKHMCLPW